MYKMSHWERGYENCQKVSVLSLLESHILHEAFMLADPKSAKKTDSLTVFFVL